MQMLRGLSPLLSADVLSNSPRFCVLPLPFSLSGRSALLNFPRQIGLVDSRHPSHTLCSKLFHPLYLVNVGFGCTAHRNVGENG